MDSSNVQTHILLPVEAEAFVESLELFQIRELGSSKWNRQHENIEKLNMQAVFNASQNQDEFVKTYLVNFDKVSLLVHEVLVVEAWKDFVFPEITSKDLENNLIFPIYMVLYHEATLVNLLETILFYEEVAEAAGDISLDLVDYCHRKLLNIASSAADENFAHKSDVSRVKETANREELKQMKTSLDFDIGMKAVSLLRYVTDHLSKMSLSTITRLLNVHDVPLLLVHLLEHAPWARRSQGKLYKYEDSRWKEVDNSDWLKLNKLEGQVWLALFQLLLGEECQRKYEMNDYRKGALLKLRSYINDILLDQLPILVELQRYLEHLSISETGAVKKDLVLEQLPEIRTRIVSQYEGKWRSLAQYQLATYFNPDNPELQEQAKRLASTYNFDVMDSLLGEAPKCSVCGSPASKRCSRCQNEWYCRRECQVKHWPKHKTVCDMLVDSLAKLKVMDVAQPTQTAS